MWNIVNAPVNASRKDCCSYFKTLWSLVSYSLNMASPLFMELKPSPSFFRDELCESFSGYFICIFCWLLSSNDSLSVNWLKLLAIDSWRFAVSACIRVQIIFQRLTRVYFYLPDTFRVTRISVWVSEKFWKISILFRYVP